MRAEGADGPGLRGDDGGRERLGRWCRPLVLKAGEWVLLSPAMWAARWPGGAREKA